MFFCLLNTSVRPAYTYVKLRGQHTHRWRVAGEQVFAGTSPGPAGSYGAHQVGLVRNSKVDHHRYTIVVLTITMMIS